jgi:hypothetical protein
MAVAHRTLSLHSSSTQESELTFLLRTLATENYPHLVDSLVLIDPVIPKPFVTRDIFNEAEAKTDGLLLNSLVRRDTWKTR